MFTDKNVIEARIENVFHVLTLWMFCGPDVQSVLQRLSSDGSLLKRSVLIGCSKQNQALFCLDVGKNM